MPAPPRFPIVRLLICCWLLALTGCRQAPARVPLTIFAAASLAEAFTELAAQFEAAHPGVRVTLNFAGSQQLAQQIAQGAPGDVFAGANEAQMAAAVASGRIDAAAPRLFAQNRLAVIFPADNPANLQQLTDLARPGLKLVLAAAEVPAGQYARIFLDKASQDAALGASYAAAVLANVVSYEQNVRTVLTKVALGEADAGIVYTSDAGSSGEPIGSLAIPDDLNQIARYPIAPLNDSPQPELAQAFVDAILSPAGQAVLQQHGFLPSGAASP